MVRKKGEKKLELSLPLWFHSALKRVAADEYRAMGIVLRLAFEAQYPKECAEAKASVLTPGQRYALQVQEESGNGDESGDDEFDG